jgi:nucleotide-binding universal stress UspA family protein
MRRFRSILVVPVTGRPDPPAALQEALALAETSGADVRVLGHLPDLPACERGIVLREQALLRDAAAKSYADRLAGWATALGAPSLPIAVASGSQPSEVANEVRSRGHDLVVIAGDETGESAAAARRILRTCPCPVWLLRPSFSGSRVLAAIDPDHGSAHNRLILELAHSQAELHSGEFHVMHAWDLPHLELARDAGIELDHSRLSSLATAVETAHKEPFEAAVHAAGIAAGPNVHLVDGPPARAIRGLTVLYRADLVVLGAGAWTEPGLGLGSTTEQVLTESESSVLVVRQPLAA